MQADRRLCEFVMMLCLLCCVMCVLTSLLTKTKVEKVGADVLFATPFWSCANPRMAHNPKLEVSLLWMEEQ